MPFWWLTNNSNPWFYKYYCNHNFDLDSSLKSITIQNNLIIHSLWYWIIKIIVIPPKILGKLFDLNIQKVKGIMNDYEFAESIILDGIIKENILIGNFMLFNYQRLVIMDIINNEKNNGYKCEIKGKYYEE